jgi:hypothetical protein
MGQKICASKNGQKHAGYVSLIKINDETKEIVSRLLPERPPPLNQMIYAISKHCRSNARIWKDNIENLASI